MPRPLSFCAPFSELAAKREANEAHLAGAMQQDSVPINPYRLVAELRDVLRETTRTTAFILPYCLAQRHSLWYSEAWAEMN